MQALQQKRLAAAMAEAERASEESEQETAKATEKPASVSSFASQLAAIKREEVLLIEQTDALERDKAVLLKQLKLIRDGGGRRRRPWRRRAKEIIL